MITPVGILLAITKLAGSVITPVALVVQSDSKDISVQSDDKTLITQSDNSGMIITNEVT